jgi:hypothetical protein
MRQPLQWTDGDPLPVSRRHGDNANDRAPGRSAFAPLAIITPADPISRPGSASG